MILLLAVIAGIVPMTIYPLFVYWMDRYEKEPLLLLGAAFLWGFVPAAVLSLIVQLVIDIPLVAIDGSGVLSELIGSTFVAPITEELFKGVAVLGIYIIWRTEFDGILDGIVYGSLVGFGFAAIENILYFGFNGEGLGEFLVLVFLRAFLFGLNHALYTSLTGIGLGIARYARSPVVRLVVPMLGLCAAVLIHGIHNASVSLAGEYPSAMGFAVLFDWVGVLVVLVIMILTVIREREWIRAQLREEVADGTLSKEQYALVASPLRRWSKRLGLLISGNFASWQGYGKYFDVLTELAFKKHARTRRGDKGALQIYINDLRRQATALSAEFHE